MAPITIIIPVLLALLSPQLTSATTEERKAAFRQAVIDNYSDTTELDTCKCGVRDNIQFPPPFDCGIEDLGSNYIGVDAVSGNNPGMAVFPYMSLTIPNEDFALDDLLCRVVCDEQTTGDFSLTIAMRTLGHADDALAAKIISRLQALYDSGELRLWAYKGEDHNIYWTENHMVMWLSATYLLRDKLVYPADDEAFVNVERRLEHFIQTRLDYGYYEWHSTNYMPFTLAALLNLYDFATPGSTIQTLAGQAVTRLMSDWLLFLNDAGAYYPVAPRNKNHWYFPVFHANTWILKGNGVPVSDHNWKLQPMGQFVALTSFNFDALEASWQPIINSVFDIGHGGDEFDVVHADLPREERVLYRWAAGYVVQAETVTESLFGLRFYELIGSNFLFDMLYTAIGWIPDFLARFFFSLFPGQTQGTGFAGAKVHLFKHNGIVLTSLEDHIPGARGFEEFPWAATVHDLAVYTQSGPDDRCVKGDISNSHLPNVVQDENVALISYKPRWDVRIPFRFLGPFVGLNLQVALSFPYDQFDEVVESGRWLMARREASYVGVWRDPGSAEYDCSGALADGDVCDQYFFSRGRTTNRASVWAVVVGNDQTHGPFDSFVATVEQGTVQEDSPSLIETFLFWQGYYRTGLTVDGKTLSSEM